MGQPLYTYPLKPVAWNERDIILFTNSIGCPPSELHFYYELHPAFAAFPTYPIVLSFKHDHTSTVINKNHFEKHLMPPKGALNGYPDFPALDIERVVDGERTLEVLYPIPTTSQGRTFRLYSTVIRAWDKGRGKPTILQTEHLLLELLPNEGGEKFYTRMTETAIFMGQGGWSGPNDPTSKPAAPPTSRPPMQTHRHHIPPNAHLLYRLNGDYNPLHAEKVDAAMIQPTPIMHGLYSWNIASSVILTRFGQGESGALKTFRAGFKAPVWPGDVLNLLMWLVREDGGEREVRFRVMVGEKIVLDNGQAVLRSVKGGQEASSNARL